MAKFNGSGIRTVQDAAPAVSDVANDVMQRAFDKAVIRASEEVMEGESDIDSPSPTLGQDLDAPSYDSGSGMSDLGQVQPLSQRMEQAQAGTLNPQMVTKNVPKSPIHRNDPSPSSSSNILGRANKMAENLSPVGRNNLSINMYPKTANKAALQPSFEARGTGVAQDTLTKAQKPLLAAEGQSNSLPTALHQKLKAFNYNLDGQYNMKPEFAKVISVTAENEIYKASMVSMAPTEDSDMTNSEFDEDGNQVFKPELINPVESVSQLGSMIEKQWNNLVAETGGEKPVPMSEQERRDVGAMAMQAYQATNPDIVKVVPNPDEEEGGIRYELIGIDELDKSAQMMNEMFDTQVPPLHNAPAELHSSLDRPVIRGGSKSIRNNRISMDVLEESVENQSSVVHVVDKQRLKIAAAMILPTIFRTPGAPNDVWGGIFGVGIAKQKTLIAREKVLNNKSDEQAKRTADAIISSKKKDLLKEVNSLVRNFGMPNYLTYNVQKLSTRVSPTQSQFNYTSNKVVRFATRGATPHILIKGKKNNGLIQTFALAMLEDDMLLDGPRYDEMMLQSKKFSDWGAQLKGLLDKAVPEEMLEPLMEAVVKDIPLDDPSFPKPPFRTFGEGITPQLKEYLDSKGMDALAAMDAMIEWNRYVNTPDGASFSTNIGAWADGKNNGVANGGNLIGSHKLAFLTGVLRDPKSLHALNTQSDGKVIDVAREMSNITLQDVEEKGIFIDQKLKGSKAELTELAKIMANERELNKAISMIFPYGKELNSMKSEVSDHILNKVGTDPRFEAVYNEGLNSGKFSHSDIVDVVHHNVTSSVVEIFGDDTFTARGLTRNSSYLMAAMDQGLTIISPSGSEMHLGGNKKDLSKSVDSSVSVNSNLEGGERSTLKVQTSPTYHSSAAAKNDRVSAKGFGRALVMPVHAIDASAMHNMFSGKVWDKIKKVYGKNSPFVRQVYDAISVDPTNYEVVMKELNNGWKDLTLEGWDYFEEMRKSVDNGRKKFIKDMEAEEGTKFTLEAGSRFDFIGALMTAEETDFGFNHATLKSFIRTTFPMVDNMDPKVYSTEVKRRANRLLADLSSVVGKDMGEVDKSVSELPTINSRQVLAIVNRLFNENEYSKTSNAIVKRFAKQRRELNRSVGNLKAESGTGSRQYHGH